MKTISIIGVGPGAIDLLTLRAIERIKEAEVILWADSLIPTKIIELAPKGCECHKTSNLTLEIIINIMLTNAKQGKKVVRLHDGDPCLFGALTEQVNRIKLANLDVEVIPGISAYQATASALKSELTIPEITQTIILSRSSGRTNVPEKENLENLASLKSSLCIYLSARHIKEVEGILLKYYSPETPVAIGHRVTWDDEWLKIVPLKEVASTTIKQGFIRTTVYIISPGLNVQDKRSKLYSKEHIHLFRKE